MRSKPSRSFDPATQRTTRQVEQVFITPAREVLPGKAAAHLPEIQEVDEYYLPLVHPAPASLLDYLPREAVVLVDDLDQIQVVASEIEEAAVKMRRDSIQEGTLLEDYPVPTCPGRSCRMLSPLPWVELGRSTAEDLPPLAQHFQPGPRFGGRLKVMMDELAPLAARDEAVIIVSRQSTRLQELWAERGDAGLTAQPPPSWKVPSPKAGCSTCPAAIIFTCSPIARFLAGNAPSPASAAVRRPKPPDRCMQICAPAIGSCMWITASGATRRSGAPHHRVR